MTIQNEHDQQPGLENVRDQFEQWRKNRKKRAAIPEHLWTAAIELSENYSISTISKTLRLNYTDLKQRIEQPQANYLLKSIRPKFIGFEITAPEAAEYTIEMTHPNGATMKAQIQGAHVDFHQLSKTFWSGAK